MVVADDVVMTCQRLSANGIAVWLTGGWGIDALLREQTCAHKDLDLLVLVDDVVRLRTLLRARRPPSEVTVVRECLGHPSARGRDPDRLCLAGWDR